jgi:Glycosyltransferases involved in cell wall biogenesis
VTSTNTNAIVPQISVVLPIFNERELLSELYRRLKATLQDMNVTHEIVFVNDGSSDGSWSGILELTRRDCSVKAVNLTRNFGHQIAITAGIESSTGTAVVVDGLGSSGSA